MDANQELENKLWSITRPSPVNQDDFNKIIDYLFNRLSAFLQQPLEVMEKMPLTMIHFVAHLKGALLQIMFST
jgi:hypothetical protein